MGRVSFVGLLLSLITITAQAGGPPETLVQVVVDPNDPLRIVMRYESAGNGLLFTQDGGQTWQSLCVEGARPADVETLTDLGPLGFGGDGTLFIGRFQGAMHDDGTGCGFVSDLRFGDPQDPDDRDEWVSDFTGDPTDPQVLYAVTSTTPDGENGVLRRTGAGAWEDIGTRDESRISRLRVVELPSGGLRMYETAIRGAVGPEMMPRPNYMVRVSDDMGATWTEHPYDIVDQTATPDFQLEAVDPTNPDRILVSVRRESMDRSTVSDEILISEDQGATFSNYVTLTQLGGLDMAPDGRVWIGDLGDTGDLEAPSGLYHAASLEASPTVVDDARAVSCVRYLPDRDEVLVCSSIAAGTVQGDGTGYVETFDFDVVESPVSCPGQDNLAACRMQYTRYWCTAAHFPTTPMCCAYVGSPGFQASPDLDCSEYDPGMDMSTGDGDSGTGGGDGDGSMVGGDGDGTMQPVGGNGGGTGTNPTPPAAGGGGTTTPPVDDSGEDDSGGCSVRGVSDAGAWPLSLFAAAGLLALRRRRRHHQR